MLAQWAEIHGAHWITRVVVLCVGDNANDFIVAGRFLAGSSKVLADRIFLREKFPDELLIDHRDHARCRSVLLGDAAASNHRLPDRLKKMRADAVPRGEEIRSGLRYRMAFDPYAFTPVVAFECTVERDTNMFHTGKRCELALQSLVEGANVIHLESRSHRVEMNHVAVRGGQSVVLLLQIAQRLCQQACADEKHQRRAACKTMSAFCGSRARSPVERFMPRSASAGSA